MVREPLLTIATVTRNCLAYTKLFIESLSKYKSTPFELIVVDNNSTDGTKEYLARQKGLVLISNKVNLGFGPANNQAFKRTRSKCFLGLNNDTVVFPGFVDRLLAIAESHPEYAEFGVASNCIGARDPETGSSINDEIAKLDQSLSQAEIIARYYGEGKTFLEHYATKNPGIDRLAVPPHFTGGWTFLVNSEVVKKVGGLFDPQFRVGFWEDADLSWRIAKAGYMIAHISELYIHHFTHVSFKANKQRRTDKQISRINALKFAAKWSDDIRIYLQQQMSRGMTLEQIAKSIHMFGSYFGRERDDYEKLEERLRKDFIQSTVNFRDFLLQGKADKKS